MRFLDIAANSLLFTESMPREDALYHCEWLQRRRDGKIDGEILPISEWCLNCLSGVCPDDIAWREALTRVADRTWSDDVRAQAAKHLSCERRCTEVVIQRLIASLSDNESVFLRGEVLSSASGLWEKAAALVPSAIEIVRAVQIDPNPLTWEILGNVTYFSEPLHYAALRVIACCQTDDQPEAVTFLCDRTNYQEYGVPTACHTIHAIGDARVAQDRYLDRLIDLATDDRVPEVIRKKSIQACLRLLHPSHRHITTLCRLLANSSTPHELRVVAFHSLWHHADSENPIAATFAKIVDDSSAPDELRFRVLCAFRSMPVKAQHVILEPALRFAQREFPLAVADIAQDLIADVIRLALPPSADADEQDFLSTALAAPFELQLRKRLRCNGLPTARPYLLGRDAVAQMLAHPWLQSQFRFQLIRRKRALANGTWDELMQHLPKYLIEVLTHPTRPLLPDPANPLGFHRKLLNRVDGFAKYHLPREFGKKSPERHGTILVARHDDGADIADSSGTPFHMLANAELLEALTDSLNTSLDDFERQVLILCIVEGMTLDSVAAIFGDTSRYQVYRAKEAALRKLRSALRQFAG